MVTAIGNVSPLTSDYNEIARRPLEADQCALVVVDIQEKLLPPIFQKEQLVKNSQLLIRLAGILRIPTLMTTQYAKGLGGTVPEIASLLPETEPIDKQMFSCFGSDVFWFTWCATQETYCPWFCAVVQPAGGVCWSHAWSAAARAAST